MSANNPRAQVPGYCGFIPGKNAQNKFGASFGHITKGAYQTNKDAFLTTNISNNQFIKKQYSQGNTFWNNTTNINVFDQSQQQQNDPLNQTKWAQHNDYKPQKLTNLTYEEAISKTNKL